MLGLSLFSCYASASQSAIRSSFVDGVPADTFELTNESSCDFGASSLLLDLSGSNGGLYFDVSAAGAGIAVYQPLIFKSGQEYLAEIPALQDGDNILVLELTAFNAGASIRFTTDLDDTKGPVSKVVSDSEITGARIQLHSASGRISAAFDDSSTATIPITACEVVVTYPNS